MVPIFGVAVLGLKAATVAVKVTDCPNTILAGAGASTVVCVLALLTTKLRVPALVLNVGSPEYTAVIVWLPTAKVAVGGKLANPFVTLTVPSSVPVAAEPS